VYNRKYNNVYNRKYNNVYNRKYNNVYNSKYNNVYNSKYNRNIPERPESGLGAAVLWDLVGILGVPCVIKGIRGT